MLPPTPRRYCALGSQCSSQDGGQEKGPDICSRCKNLSYQELRQRAINRHDDIDHLKRLVDGYFQQLEKNCLERIEKEWGFPCACKDPLYKEASWRRHFDPEDYSPCGTVRHRGQLCTRCHSKAREQQCSWLINFDGDRFGFPCVWDDPRLRRPVDQRWKTGPLYDGKPDEYWRSNPGTKRFCKRAVRQYQLCQPCYNRMCNISGFGLFFHDTYGTLHEQYSWQGLNTGDPFRRGQG